MTFVYGVFSLSFYHYSMLAAEGHAMHDDFWYQLVSYQRETFALQTSLCDPSPLRCHHSFGFPVSLVESSAVKTSIISHLLTNVVDV